jgi:hypothetical protein
VARQTSGPTIKQTIGKHTGSLTSSPTIKLARQQTGEQTSKQTSSQTSSQTFKQSARQAKRIVRSHYLTAISSCSASSPVRLPNTFTPGVSSFLLVHYFFRSVAATLAVALSGRARRWSILCISLEDHTHRHMRRHKMNDHRDDTIYLHLSACLCCH